MVISKCEHGTVKGNIIVKIVVVKVYVSMVK